MTAPGPVAWMEKGPTALGEKAKLSKEQECRIQGKNIQWVEVKEK